MAIDKSKEVLIFAGTSEGRRLSEYLSDKGVYYTVCVATEYGEIALKAHPMLKVRKGRMNRSEIKDFIINGNFAAIVDATHPYAQEVTRNVKAAAEETGVLYFRLIREHGILKDFDNVCYFETHEACADALADTKGNILLAIGSKELSKYCVSEELKQRLYVRVLPDIESISICNRHGIQGKHVIAMQGPFTVAMNEAMIAQYDVSYLVTKESGLSGGFREKLEAAKKKGVQAFVIGCPKEEQGYSFEEICAELEKLCNMQNDAQKTVEKLEITLAGIGMGHECGMTKEVRDAIDKADILLGSQRLIVPYEKHEKKPFYRAKQIIPYLNETKAQYRKIAVLFSGDSSFYSGAGALHEALKKEIDSGSLNASIKILPGISSVAYLAACIGETWHDAAVYSMHGQEICNFVRKIKYSEKTFLLTSGVKDINLIGKLLTDAQVAQCEITAGHQLSYKDQKIQRLTPQECVKLEKDGLYTCFIKNPYAIDKNLTHGIPDDEFIRADIPMTKEEVRAVSICKLRLNPKSVVYDIGSGTGSVAVEIASLSDDIQVYAIERKKDALSLIQKNREKFQLQNITAVEADAPDGLLPLPAATHAFIGGSGKKLREIVGTLLSINPKMRIAINAISLETICEIREILDLFDVKNAEIIQLWVGKAKLAGEHHLMKAENPVWICAFGGV